MNSHKEKTSVEHKAAPVKTHNGEPISTTRDAIKGDPGFNGTDGQQAVIKTASGQEKTVLHTELSAG